MKIKMVYIIVLMLLITTVLPVWARDVVQDNEKKSIGLSGGTYWPMFHHDNRHTGYTDAISDILSPGEKWSFSTGDGVSSSAAIGNIDNTGGIEVVVGSNNGDVYALNGKTGGKKWSYSTSAAIESSPAIADIDGDGENEVVVGSNNGDVYALNGKTGGKKWSYSTSAAIESSPAIADIDGDGENEVVVGSNNGDVYALNGKTGGKKWSYSTSAAIESSPAIADIDGDGENEVVVGSNNGDVYALNGKTGGKKWSYSTSAAITSSPAIADIDGDGENEVVVGSNNGDVYALNGKTGGKKWSYSTSAAIESSPAIADIDGDGENEVVVGSNNGDVYALNGKTGGKKWSYSTSAAIESSPAIADIDGDGENEVVVGSNNGDVYALNGKTGGKKWSYSTSAAITSSPAIADIDGDGKAEIIVGSDDGNIYTLCNGYPPETPQTPDGPTSGKIDHEYCYNTSTSIHEDIQFYFYWDWNDGNKEWFGPFESNDPCKACHEWDKKGTYKIKVMARSDPDNDGVEDPDNDGLNSEWSDYLTVNIDDNGCCFVAGTKITMANGSYKNIENVKIGDIVRSYDEETKQYENNKVLELESPIREGYYKIYSKCKSLIEVTDEHPFYTKKPDGSIFWCSLKPETTHEYYPNLYHVRQLEIDDLIYRDNGTWVRVNGWDYIKGPIQTYNLEHIENTHTFFANDLLVHNKCCFAAGTKITMADGSYKNIEEIMYGDRVLSYDLKYARFTSWTVKMLGNPVNSIYDINDGLILVTADHPIYIQKPDGRVGIGAIDRDNVPLRQRVDVLQLQIGDKLFTKNGEWIEVTKIIFKPELVHTHNLMSYLGTRTFFANDILVYEENAPISYWIENKIFRNLFFTAFFERFPNVFPLLRQFYEWRN